MNYHSHIGQDRWVAEILGFRSGGYFLEFGALDGVLTSNTYALEKELGWKGISVEANPTHYPELCANRSCITINNALWPRSREVVEMVDAHGLSSVVVYKDDDTVASLRKEITTRRFVVDTVNPTELLDRFQAPGLIEYLSLDVEGCEIDVLTSLDFTRYQIALLTVEHSENVARQGEIRALMKPLGYEVIERHYDDWFYRSDLLEGLRETGEVRDPIEVYEGIAANFVIPQ